MTDREGAKHEGELCMRGRAKHRERAKDERGGKHEREVR